MISPMKMKYFIFHIGLIEEKKIEDPLGLMKSQNFTVMFSVTFLRLWIAIDKPYPYRKII